MAAALPPPAAGWTVSKAPALAGGAAAGVRRFRGLSVAEAARASTIAFRPLRANGARREADARRGCCRRRRGRAAAGRRAAPAGPQRAGPGSGRPTPPAQPPLPAEPALRERGEATRHQRFAKTIAELQRYQAASREREPGSDLVPRPTLPLEDRDTGGAWSWLWSRRKSGDHA